MNNGKTVFVGISGGVDSSVSASLLKEKGYSVFGIFLRTWQPDWIDCTIEEEKRDAIRVCASLDIPFIELDLSERYKKDVADYMINEYRKGNTPNPDVMCNKAVKFGAFLKFAEENGADFIATGHYARNIFNTETSEYELHRGIDNAKDQSYFLWTLTQRQLSKTLFPIGNLEKKRVRELAKKYNLHTATKKDSQGICFIGKVNMKDFLSHYMEKKSGKVLDVNGNVIGKHDGALFFTLGERHGFEIIEKGTNDVPYYVVEKDIGKNTITVSNKPVPQNNTDEVSLSIINLINKNFDENKKYIAQIRYHGKKHKISVLRVNNNNMKIKFEEKPLIARGQSVAVYDNDRCIGGGILK